MNKKRYLLLEANERLLNLESLEVPVIVHNKNAKKNSKKEKVNWLTSLIRFLIGKQHNDLPISENGSYTTMMIQEDVALFLSNAGKYNFIRSVWISVTETEKIPRLEELQSIGLID